MSVTIKSDAPDGTHVEITLTKTAKDKGTITVKKWENGGDPASTQPSSDEETKLYDIRAASSGGRIACKADVTGSDPDVTFVLADAPPVVNVTIKGTTFGIGDGTTDYPTTAADITKLKQFIKDSAFPAVG